MSKRLLLLVAVTVVLLTPIFLLPASQSASLPKLKAKGTDAIDRLFEAAIANKELPGVVAAVVNKDQLLYLNAFGAQGEFRATNGVESNRFRRRRRNACRLAATLGGLPVRRRQR